MRSLNRKLSETGRGRENGGAATGAHATSSRGARGDQGVSVSAAGTASQSPRTDLMDGKGVLMGPIK